MSDMTKPTYTDFPWDDVIKGADEKIAQGGDVYQKFTCEKCGQRLTMETPNVFHEKGTCDQCHHVTDIKARGCNYMVHFQFGRKQ